MKWIKSKTQLDTDKALTLIIVLNNLLTVKAKTNSHGLSWHSSVSPELISVAGDGISEEAV